MPDENPSISELKNELDSLANPEQAKILQGFFKTGKGQYGEGDIFLGIKVPVQRKVAKNYYSLPLKEIQKLLKSKIHDYRMVAIFILVHRYEQAAKKDDEKGIKEIFDFYMANTHGINNWDLVDLSAPKISGHFLSKRPRKALYDFARSDDLWKRRIAILSTYAFIRENDFDDTFKITELLLNDKHDLMHKACGWMLREVGKKDQSELESFLKKHYKGMPRTMLRYSIERFEETKRKKYLNSEV